MPSPSTLIETSLQNLPLLRRGKVRDVYTVDDNHLLIVATDRISAFDCILPTPIPFKGAILTTLSSFWFEKLSSLTRNHLVSTNVAEMPPSVKEYSSILKDRSVYVLKTDVIPIECVVRGYISGSGWKDYKRTGQICGHTLPAGLRESDKLPEAIFTPATKAESGHDINISEPEAADIIGKETTARLRDLSISLYTEAANYALSKGIIIADTKFEFGRTSTGDIILIDEALTPDSSRFWPVDLYSPGNSQPSFDKQFVRDYLESLDWNKEPPAPELPPNIVASTSERYLTAFRLLTGQPFKTN